MDRRKKINDALDRQNTIIDKGKLKRMMPVLPEVLIEYRALPIFSMPRNNDFKTPKVASKFTRSSQRLYPRVPSGQTPRAKLIGQITQTARISLTMRT